MTAMASSLPRSPKRNTPTRSPLQERSHSEANQISSRLSRDPRDDPGTEILTPFPTKASHVLLPSTVRKQRAGNGNENVFPAILGPNQQSSNFANSSRDNSINDRSKSVRTPALALKRSVAALRDMYEAQDEKSRPSTAASPILRPTTASSRLRSASSGDGLSGRYAWEALRKASSDDIALLPSLDEAVATVKKITSESSFQSRAARTLGTSSPNFVAIGSSSSPRFPVYSDVSSPVLRTEDQSPSSRPGEGSSSSPNVVQLGRSSSFDDTTERSSSPNFVKLGSSSPSNATTGITSSSPGPLAMPESPRKRKRDDEGRSFAARVGAANVMPSSPPYESSIVSSSAQDYPSPDNSVTLPSSPPKQANLQLTGQEVSPGEKSRKFSFESSSESQSLAETHASLQAALTSSPVPTIQYPVIRAPATASITGLTIPKRSGRISADLVSPRWTSRLSTVPSEWSGARTNSKRSSFVDDLDDVSDNDSNFAASRTFLAMTPEVNSSQVRMVSAPDVDADYHEASDEVSALPGHEFQYQSQHRSPPPPVRSSSYLGTLSSSSNSGSRLNSLRNSMDNRLNSMKSFSHSRHNSLRSSSQRPSSSSSAMSNFPVPTWARRYYSGVYRDSFQHMYSSGRVSSSSNLTPSVPSSTRPSTSTSRPVKRTDQSPRHFPLNMFLKRARPRLEARKSHVEPGMGPLVSNPVSSRLPPPAATYQNTHLQPTADLRSETQTNRTMSLHPADPRAHWAGITPEQLQALRDTDSYQTPPSRHSTLMPRRARSEWSPHLYGGRRNSMIRSMWHAPSVDEAGEKWFSLRNAQVICFLLGFVCPLGWFVGAILRLPTRPVLEDLDLEKDDRANSTMGVEEGDLGADLAMRVRRQIARADRVRWENARWWRGLNRFMCAVGVVVIAVVVTLAVLGTRGGGF